MTQVLMYLLRSGFWTQSLEIISRTAQISPVRIVLLCGHPQTCEFQAHPRAVTQDTGVREAALLEPWKLENVSWDTLWKTHIPMLLLACRKSQNGLDLYCVSAF